MRRYGLVHAYSSEYRTTTDDFRVIRGWGDQRGWTVLQMTGPGECEVLDTWPTLRAAKDDIDRRKAGEV